MVWKLGGECSGCVFDLSDICEVLWDSVCAFIPIVVLRICNETDSGCIPLSLPGCKCQQ